MAQSHLFWARKRTLLAHLCAPYMRCFIGLIFQGWEKVGGKVVGRNNLEKCEKILRAL